MSTIERALNPIDAALEDASYASTLDMQQKHLAIAQIEATRAQTAVLERIAAGQEIANRIAAFRAELIVNPYGVGTREHDQWWVEFGTPITQAVTA